MLDLHDPLVQVRVASVTCSTAAILSSLCRLFIRRKRLWVDDAAVLFSLLALVVQIIAAFLTPKPGTNIGEIRYYMLACTFFAVLWSARLSILFSLIRINPFPEHRLKLKLLTLLFIIIPCLLTLQCLLTCIPKPEWKTWSVPVCVLDDSSAICQLLADIIADLILLFIPTRLLMILSDKHLRIRLILIFSTCIITSIAGLAHAIEIVKFLHSARIYTAIIENNIALIICNTPVLLTSFLDLKESSWEERNSHFLVHELRNLELSTSTSPPPTTTDDIHLHHIVVATGRTNNSTRRFSSLLPLSPLPLLPTTTRSVIGGRMSQVEEDSTGSSSPVVEKHDTELG